MIITVSREFGSGGRELGKRLADALNIPCYEEGKVVSLTLAQRPGVGMTLFAFDAGEGCQYPCGSGRCYSA